MQAFELDAAVVERLADDEAAALQRDGAQAGDSTGWLGQNHPRALALAHVRGIDLPPDSIAKVMSFVDGLPEDATSSMQRDIAAGKPSELESQNGAVVRMARESGVEVPTHARIYETLRDDDAGVATEGHPYN